MGIKKELGKKIKKFRKEKGYTQEKLSELVDISQRALSKIEIGENFITAETLDKLLVALDITAEELFATNKEKDPAELLEMINNDVKLLKNDSEKLAIIHNLTKSLINK